jgi:REP element-mobilizing transposase RayT
VNTYAVTAVMSQRRSIFLRIANAKLLVNTMLGHRDQGRFLLHGFAVVPEHLHVLLTPESGQTLERCVQCIKGSQELCQLALGLGAVFFAVRPAGSLGVAGSSESSSRVTCGS